MEYVMYAAWALAIGAWSWWEGRGIPVFGQKRWLRLVTLFLLVTGMFVTHPWWFAWVPAAMVAMYVPDLGERESLFHNAIRWVTPSAVVGIAMCACTETALPLVLWLGAGTIKGVSEVAGTKWLAYDPWHPWLDADSVTQFFSGAVYGLVLYYSAVVGHF